MSSEVFVVATDETYMRSVLSIGKSIGLKIKFISSSLFEMSSTEEESIFSRAVAKYQDIVIMDAF